MSLDKRHFTPGTRQLDVVGEFRMTQPEWHNEIFVSLNLNYELRINRLSTRFRSVKSNEPIMFDWRT